MSNLKREGVSTRNFSRKRRFRLTGSRKSDWCSLCVVKDILHVSENTHSYLCVFRNKSKLQLDSTGFLLQILLLAQHVSGTTMPIILSSRLLYSVCCLRNFVLWFSSCWSGAELRVMCLVCGMLAGLLHPTEEGLLWWYYKREVWFSSNPCYKEAPKWPSGIMYPSAVLALFFTWYFECIIFGYL